tara:strand:+ start:8335 stop:9270 length:936 start_codon:yes stop_codon:yes gene_type:complete
MHDNKLIFLLKDYIFHIEKVINYSPNTVSSYKRDINSFINFCKKIEVDNVSNIDEKIIREFVSHLHRNSISPKSIKRFLSSLRGFFNFLLKKKIIKKNFAEGVRSPKADKNLPEILQHSDINLLANSETKNDSYYKNKDLLARDTAIFELFYSSGLRLSELAEIQLKDINFNESLLRITGKGNKTRVVPIGTKAISAVNLWIKIRKKYINEVCNFLFTSLKGSKMSPRNIQLRMNILAKASGVEQRLYPHKLRHTVATHLLESSGNIRAVQEFLGHENISTTQIYTHLDNQYLMTVYDKVHPRSKKIIKKE